MLVTKQPILRRFWYPVMPASSLEAGPRPFRLLGTDLVLWRTGPQQLGAVRDRCCHRTAQLSKGFCQRGRLICGYHGWEYNEEGRVVRLPQVGLEDRNTSMRIDAYHVAERYGYAWVALEDPLYPIPIFEEADAVGFRQIDQFYEEWRCAGLRLMENSFDNAHFSFVHRTSFGDVEQPQPSSIEIADCDDGFLMTSVVPVKNPPLQQRNLQTNEVVTTRHVRARWHMPFLRKLQITYPTGLVHSIVTAATPIDDRRSQIVQFCFRNDTENQASAADIIRFDRTVTLEDREILESTDFDAPLNQRGREYNMRSDKPGVVMRKMLASLLSSHGETEVTQASVV